MPRDTVAYSSPGLERLLRKYPLYYADAHSLLSDAAVGAFERIHVQHHSCVWTHEPLRNGENDDHQDNDDIDENDYWYLGSMPRASPAVAVSVYGIPTGGHRRSSQTASACHRKTFINTFLIHPLRMVGDDNNDDGFADYGDSICNEEEGQGMGCSSTGAFVWQEFSLDWNGNAVCDARHTLTVLDPLTSFNTKLHQELDCMEVTMTNGGGDDDDDSLSLYNLLNGAAVCSFEDTACPDPFGVLQEYHALALGNVTVHDTTVASNLMLGAAFLLLGSIGMITWELLVNGGTSDRGEPENKGSKSHRRLSKKRRSKRRKQQQRTKRSPQKSRTRVWHSIFPRSEDCCDGDETFSMATNQDKVLELPRVDTVFGPKTCKDDSYPPENDIPPIVSSFEPPAQSHDDSIEIVTKKGEPMSKQPGGLSTNGKKLWFQTKSPITREREHQLLAAAVAAATHAKQREAEVASREPEESHSSAPDTDFVLKSKAQEETEAQEKGRMAQVLGSLVVKAIRTAGDEETPSDDDDATTAVDPATASKTQPNSGIVIPRIHVKMTEPGSDVSIVETIAEQKKLRDPRLSILRGMVENRNASGPSETLGQDPPGFLTRVPTLEEQAAKERKGDIEETQIMMGAIKKSIFATESRNEAEPPDTNELQPDTKREPNEKTSLEPREPRREKKRESDKKSFLNRVFRRLKS